MERLVAKLLNDARGSGIPDTEDVAQLVIDFFTSDSNGEKSRRCEHDCLRAKDSDQEDEFEEVNDGNAAEKPDSEPLVQVDSFLPPNTEELDAEDMRKLQKCGCKCSTLKTVNASDSASGSSSARCWTQFSLDEVRESREQWKALGASRDVAIMACLMSQHVSSGTRAYLYNSIRPYVSDCKKDILCPQPSG